MHGPLFDVYDANCPSRTALNRIGDRWTALIVGVLSQRAHRFGEHGPIERRLQRAEFDYLRESRAAQTAFAENYVGLPLS